MERSAASRLRANAGLIGAVMSGFGWLDPATAALTPIGDPASQRPGHRFDDGKSEAQNAQG